MEPAELPISAARRALLHSWAVQGVKLPHFEPFQGETSKDKHLRRNLVPVSPVALLWDVPMPSEVVPRCCPHHLGCGGWVKVGSTGKGRYFMLVSLSTPRI